MPSKSKSQQRFFGMIDAYKKGELKNASSNIKKAAKGMSMDDVKDFAETKHKGLPEKVEEQTIIRLTESDLHKIVKESVRRVLKESSNNLRELAQRLAEVGGGSLTDEERELLRNAGYTFNTISGPGYRVTEILVNGRRAAKTINGKTKWY